MSAATQWPLRQLGEICEFKYGRSLPESARSGGEVKVYGSNGVVGGHDVPLTASETIVIGRKGSHGEVNFSDKPCWPIDTTYFVDSTATKANLNWLKYRLAGARLNQMNRAAAVPGLNREDAYRVEILLPPLEEQRRIAAILDQAETLRTQRRQALAHLDTLTQSLFHGMFGDPAINPRRFQTKSLGEVSTFYGGNSLPHGLGFTGQAGGYFLMKVSDMNLPGNEREIFQCQSWSNVAGSKASTCPIGSIVVPKRGGAIGTNKKRITTRLTVLDPNLMAICPDHGQLNQAFLFQWFLDFDLASIASGGSVPQLNKQDLAPLTMLVPPLPLQKTFATRIQAIEALKATHRTALQELDKLFASLQHRAFTGEL